MVLLAVISCKTDVKEARVILMVDKGTPMLWNYLKIYKDNNFEYENRLLLKKPFYKGRVKINRDTLNFEHNESIPDFGDIAVIDGIFLTYTNGIYRELLEISLNIITK